MEYIKVEDGIIVEHCCGETLPEDGIEVPSNFPGYIGIKLAALNEDMMTIKPLTQQVSEGILEIPEGYKIDEEKDILVQKSQEELDLEHPIKYYAKENEFSCIEVHFSFDNQGVVKYNIPDGYIEMKTSQPEKYYYASSTGEWILDEIKKEEYELTSAKQDRSEAVSKITVEVDGMVFDGDEVSQERMSRTITAAKAIGKKDTDTTTWVLHNNTVAQVSVNQLSQALYLAGEEQTRLWTIPYES